MVAALLRYGCMLCVVVAAAADRLTYLNLIVDTALMHITLPSNSQLPGGQYGPRVFIGSVALEGNPTLTRTGDASANAVGSTEILEVRIGLQPLVLRLDTLYIDGNLMSATLTLPINSVHLALLIPEAPGCGIQVTTLTVESLDAVLFNSSNSYYSGQNMLVQQYIKQYVMPQVNGYLSVVRQMIQQKIYFFCLNVNGSASGVSPYFQYLISDLQNGTRVF